MFVWGYVQKRGLSSVQEDGSQPASKGKGKALEHTETDAVEKFEKKTSGFADEKRVNR